MSYIYEMLRIYQYSPLFRDRWVWYQDKCRVYLDEYEEIAGWPQNQ